MITSHSDRICGRGSRLIDWYVPTPSGLRIKSRLRIINARQFPGKNSTSETTGGLPNLIGFGGINCERRFGFAVRRVTRGIIGWGGVICSVCPILLTRRYRFDSFEACGEPRICPRPATGRGSQVAKAADCKSAIAGSTPAHASVIYGVSVTAPAPFFCGVALDITHNADFRTFGRRRFAKWGDFCRVGSTMAGENRPRSFFALPRVVSCF